MIRYLLDTNIWVAAAKADSRILRRLRGLKPAHIVTCAVVRAELMFGARKSARTTHNLSGFRALLAPFESLPFDDAAADQYGLIRARLESAGTPIGANDLQIAAIALAQDCVLVTSNCREFEWVAGLQVELWA